MKMKEKEINKDWLIEGVGRYPPTYTCMYCKRYFKWLFTAIGGTDLLPLEKVEAY